jgi:hypothetical protein
MEARMILAETDMASSATHIIEQGGLFGALAIILTICLIQIWSKAIAPALDRVVMISGQVRDVVSGTERTAQILSDAVQKLDPKAMEHSNK